MKIKSVTELQAKTILHLMVATYWVGYLSGNGDYGLDSERVTKETANIKELYKNIVGNLPPNP